MKHMKKITRYWLWILLLASTLAPDAVIWLLHHLVVGIFEILEAILDEIVEHFFHTDRHTTQIIVFYIMFGMFSYLAYKSVRLCQHKLTELKTHYPIWREQLKAHWQQQSIPKKLRVVCSIVGALGVSYLMF